jgi:hypothetical protein
VFCHIALFIASAISHLRRFADIYAGGSLLLEARKTHYTVSMIEVEI